MQAKALSLESLLERKRFEVPSFQRDYCWGKKEWDSLWSDLMDLYEHSSPHNHFMGAIVTIVSDIEEYTFTLIDGQQRIITLVLVLLILMRKCDKSNEKSIKKLLEDNEGYKLKRSSNDNDTFVSLMGSDNRQKDHHQIVDAFRYFQAKIDAQQLNFVKLLNLIKSKLFFVSVALDHQDNPSKVFETLNAMGKKLSDSDLIHNVMYNLIHNDTLFDKNKQRRLSDVWNKMKNELQEKFADFIEDFLLKEGYSVKPVELFLVFKRFTKNRLERPTRNEDRRGKIEKLVNELSMYSEFYYKIISPEKETNIHISQQLERLDELGITAPYPFLLMVYNAFSSKLIKDSDMVSILKILENFLVRRFLCYDQNVGNVFLSLCKRANGFQPRFLPIEIIKKILADSKYPTDSEFKNKLVDGEIYIHNKLAKFVLRSLERFLYPKENVVSSSQSDSQIEHIMPQSPSESWWQGELTRYSNEQYQKLVNGIGNLTLTSYNPELGNRDFKYKKEIFQNSNIGLNKYFIQLDEWGPTEIKNRAEVLATTALKLWPDLVQRDDIRYIYPDSYIAGLKPTEIVFCGELHDGVKHWHDITEVILKFIYDNFKDKFSEIVNEYPKIISTKKLYRRSGRPLLDNYILITKPPEARSMRYYSQWLQLIGLQLKDVLQFRYATS
jgi:uncharacterized protein with ParB-like and HNH nuclease domain